MRNHSESPPPPEPETAAEAEANTSKPPSAPSTTSVYLCQIATGHLAPARQRLAELLADPEVDKDDLAKLLAAIAMKDGASFDALVAGLPEDRRRDLTLRTSLLLGQDPAGLLRVMAESEHMSGILLAHAPDAVGSAADEVPGVLLDLVERGEIHWSAETMQRMVMRYWMNKEAAARTVTLIKNGKIAIDDPETIGRLMLGLGDGDLARLREGEGAPQIAAALEAEAKARAIFADFKPTAETWKSISSDRMLMGLDLLVRSSGLPDFDWTTVPPEQLDKIALGVHGALPHDQKIGFLKSIASSGLETERKNDILAVAAHGAFHVNNDINLAMEFALAIKDRPDGSNPGQDLIVDWVAFDPQRAKEYAASLPESPLRQRILQRAEEVSP